MSDLAGRTIRDVRMMTDAELESEGWGDCPDWERSPVIVLDDGTLLYASRDPEGNGLGMLFGTDPQGQSFLLIPARTQTGRSPP